MTDTAAEQPRSSDGTFSTKALSEPETILVPTLPTWEVTFTISGSFTAQVQAASEEDAIEAAGEYANANSDDLAYELSAQSVLQVAEQESE